MNALAIHLYLIIRYINLSFNYFGNFYRIVNIGMAQDCFGPADDMAVAIDPSFISKAGRLTYGIGRFWSGVAQRVKRGLGHVIIVRVRFELYLE